MTPQETVETLTAAGLQLLIWSYHTGDGKHPSDKNWPSKPSATPADYHENAQVGVKLGTEAQPGRFVVDIDIDWGPGAAIAASLLPDTGFTFGHKSKPVSHSMYLVAKAIPITKYFDIDKTTLLELRGTEKNGDIGHQTMVPPSIWRNKEGKNPEPLEFRPVPKCTPGTMAFVDNPERFIQLVTYSAIGALLAKHLGINGFGHEVRLAWAGFLLRAGVSEDDLIAMGKGMSIPCNNLEMDDVQTCVQSASAQLKIPNSKVVGGPTLVKLLGKTGRAVVARINEWLGRDDFIRDQNGLIVKDSQDNIHRAMDVFEIDLAHQEFADKMLITEKGRTTVLNDAIRDELWLRVDRDLRFRPSAIFFEKVIYNMAYTNPFHPVRDYLHDLQWDGVARLDHWLCTYAAAVDTEYCRAVSAIVLMAAVRRVRSPGCKYDEMLVLESEQGMNKSSALRALCPKDDWFSDDLPLNVDAKQIIERTLGKWIIEASDLAGKRKAEVEQLKSMLSRQVDGPARLAYARIPVERARQFIIIGTTNATYYLNDPTGARRFWPIRIQGFNVDSIRRDRNQIWAEAAHREALGESIRLPERLWGAAAIEQEDRHEQDSWEAKIVDLLDDLQPGSDGRKKVMTSLLWDAVEVETARQDTAGARRISEIMRRLGYERGKVWDGERGKTVVGYSSPRPKLQKLDLIE